MTIKELRESLKLSQPAFAKAIGVGTSSVGAYELGTRKPSDKVLAKIKEVYNVELTVEAAKPAEKKAAPAEKKAAKPAAEKKAAKPAAEKKAAAPAAEKKAAKPAAEKKAAKPAEKKAAPAAEKKQAKPQAKKAVKKSPAKKAAEPQVIIQSPLGGEITPFAVLAKVGTVDKVYIRVDLNKAFWVKGTETGSVDLW